MSHKISLAHLSLLEIGSAERVRIAAAVGYDMIGVRLTPGDDVPPYLTERVLRRELACIISDSGLSVCDAEFIRMTPTSDVAEMEAFMACAAELGAQHLLVSCFDPHRSRATETFAGLCRAAATYHLTAELEFNPWSHAPDLAAARAIVEGAGDPNGGIMIDALHAHRAGVTLAEMSAVPAARIRFIQMCDALRDYDHDLDEMKRIARRERLPPGEGELDCVGVVRSLPAEATIAVETPNERLQRDMGAEGYARALLEATRATIAAADRANAGPAAAPSPRNI